MGTFFVFLLGVLRVARLFPNVSRCPDVVMYLEGENVTVSSSASALRGVVVAQA